MPTNEPEVVNNPLKEPTIGNVASGETVTFARTSIPVPTTLFKDTLG